MNDSGAALAQAQLGAVLGFDTSSSSSDRPISAGRRVVAASAVCTQSQSRVSDGLLSQSYPGPPQAVSNGGPPVGPPPQLQNLNSIGNGSPACRPGPSMGLAAAPAANHDADALVAAAVAATKAEAESLAENEAQKAKAKAEAQAEVLAEAQQRAQVLEQQVQQLLANAAQQQAQTHMQQAFAQREQAMAAQIQDLKDKLKETVEL